MRCGVTGLRPTYGRVARTGAMTLCWSLDKLGPMTRGVEDAMLVLARHHRPRRRRRRERAAQLDFDATAPRARACASATCPAWMNEAPATDVDRAALPCCESLGLAPRRVTLPDWPYDVAER